MFEIELGDAVALHIRSGIEEIDGVGDLVLDGELDGVHFVAEGQVDGLRVFDDARGERVGKIFVFDEVAALVGIVADGSDVVFSEGEAADVAGEVDEFLQGHAVGRGFVVRGEEFFLGADLVDVFPTAAGERLEDGRAADVIEETVPIDGIGEVVQGFGSDVDVAGIALLREENGFGDSEAELRGDGIVEKFVVSGPPEGIVDDVGALQDGVLEVAAIIFDFVGNAVDDDGVFGGLVHARAAELDEFGGDAVGFAELVHPDDESRREAVFTAAENANLLHGELLKETRMRTEDYCCTGRDSINGVRGGGARGSDDSSRLLHSMFHDGAQVAGLLEDAKLALGAGAFVENGVNVFDGTAAAELVDHVVDKGEQLNSQIGHGHFGF